MEWIPVNNESLPPEDVEVLAWHRGKARFAKRRIVGETTLWHYEGERLYTYDQPEFYSFIKPPLIGPPN